MFFSKFLLFYHKKPKLWVHFEQLTCLYYPSISGFQGLFCYMPIPSFEIEYILDPLWWDKSVSATNKSLKTRNRCRNKLASQSAPLFNFFPKNWFFVHHKIEKIVIKPLQIIALVVKKSSKNYFWLTSLKTCNRLAAQSAP